MARQDDEPYNYRNAGFSVFLRRSIDNPRDTVTSLKDYGRTAQQNVSAINFDNAPVSGNMAGVTRVGKRIILDGEKGRISLIDDNSTEVGRVGSVTDE